MHGVGISGARLLVVAVPSGSRLALRPLLPTSPLVLRHGRLRRDCKMRKTRAVESPNLVGFATTVRRQVPGRDGMRTSGSVFLARAPSARNGAGRI